MKNGLLLLDKPSGMTSHDVVYSVRRWSSQKQVGHAGTLDPLATGLMVVLMGEATKLSDYILNGDKAYIVTLKLGVTTDSGDSDGQVTAEKSAAHLSEEQVKAAVQNLQGDFVWPVPIYSAVKTGGKKLYELARANVPVVPPSKPMNFKEVKLMGMGLPEVTVYLACSKGSFVRTWVQQLGESLGTGATVVSLRRTASIPYSIDNAIHLDALASFEEGGCWIPLQQSLPDWWSLKVEGQEEKLIKNGQIPYKTERFLEIECPAHAPGVKIQSRRDGSLLALVVREKNRFLIKRVFSYN